MNFYDVYTTLSLNPETQQTLNKISDFLGCQNQLEPMKNALFKKPNRVQFPGAFPFDEETGKIYDTLWKAADAENYSTAGKIGRWFMKLICPPADDEGMAALLKKPEQEVVHDPESYSNQSNNQDYNQNEKQTVTSESFTNSYTETQNSSNEQKQNTWEVSDDDEENVIVIESGPKNKSSSNDIIKRSNKKGD